MEFVRPVEEIVKGLNMNYEIHHYLGVDLEVANKFDKIIICGTSLQDHGFIDDIERFVWLNEFGGSVLGICAGMHILGLVFGGKLNKKKEVGYYRESVVGEFLGMDENPDEGEYEVWHLHKSYVDFDEKDWNVFIRSSDSLKFPEAVKHKEKEFYGVLFHPEVRNREVIKEFVSL